MPAATTKHRRGAPGGRSPSRAAAGFLAAAALALCLPLPAASPQSASPPPRVQIVEPSDDDLLLMALQLDSATLSEELEGYVHGQGVLLPLGEVCRLLGLGISVTAPEGKAQGFVISEERRFSLDCARGEVSIAGHPAPYDPSRVEVHRNDIYVDADLLGQWLPLTLEVDRHASLVRVHPREPLPIQMRMERERRLAQTRVYLPPRDPGYPRLVTPYLKAAPPLVDQSATLTLGTGGHPNAGAYSALAIGELLHTTASLFLSAGRQQGAIARMTFSRADPDGQLLGRLHAREVAFGETPTPEIPLVSRMRQETGLVISRYPLNLQSEYDKHSFQGNLQAGWDVELYRDDILLAYQPEAGNGRYQFNDIPLLLGMNRFRLVFYGPHGERREEEQRFYVGDTSLSQKENRYRFTLHTQDGGLRLGSQYDLSLAGGLSASLAGQVIPVEGTTHSYLSAGLRRSWQGVFARMDLASDVAGGWATETGVQTRVGPVDLLLRQTLTDHFASELFLPGSSPVRSRTLLRLEGVPTPRFLNLLPSSVEITREQTESGLTRWQFSTRQSAYIRRVWLSHQLQWEAQGAAGGPSTRTGRGAFLASRRVRDLDVHGELQYDFTPAWRLSALSVTATRQMRADKMITFGISRTLGSGATQLFLGLTQHLGGAALSTGVTKDSSGAASNLALSGGTLRDPRTGRWLFSPRPVATTGTVAVRTFFDRNLNGKMDPDEKPLAGVGFFVNQASHEAVTDKQGCAMLTNLPPYLPADISVSTATLEDVTWTPRTPGARVVPRPGSITVVDFPIVGTGEVAGTVYLEGPTGKRAAAGLQVEVAGSGDTPPRSTRSAYDGFFVLSGLPPGHYALRIAPGDLARLKLAPDPGRPLEVPAEGTVVDGADLTVRPEPVAPAGR